MADEEKTIGNDRLTNAEVLAQIAQMSAEERNLYGVTAEMAEAALKASGGDRSAASSFYAQYTPLFNAFTGFVVKFALSDLSKATYRDVYGKHHRNMTQGRPQLGFVKRAGAGNGNHDANFADDTTGSPGRLSTVVTATMPPLIALYDIDGYSYEARVPISYEDVKTAFNTEYGINDLYVKVREGLEDAIVEGRNGTYDSRLTDVYTSGKIAAGTGSEIAANAAKATYVDVKGGGDYAGDLSDLTEDQLVQVLISIKNAFYGMVSRPNAQYNALGVENNAKRDTMVCYMWAPLYAELSRVKASVFDARALEDDGLKIEPLIAPWLGLNVANRVCLAAVGTADFIVDYPVSDFASVVPTDRGVIECRFMSTQVAIRGYEPWCFICGADLSVTVRKLTITGGTAHVQDVTLVGDNAINYSTGVSALTVNKPLANLVGASGAKFALSWAPVDGQGTAKTETVTVSGMSGGRTQATWASPVPGLYDLTITLTNPT